MTIESVAIIVYDRLLWGLILHCCSGLSLSKTRGFTLEQGGVIAVQYYAKMNLDKICVVLNYPQAI